MSYITVTTYPTPHSHQALVWNLQAHWRALSWPPQRHCHPRHETSCWLHCWQYVVARSCHGHMYCLHCTSNRRDTSGQLPCWSPVMVACMCLLYLRNRPPASFQRSPRTGCHQGTLCPNHSSGCPSRKGIPGHHYRMTEPGRRCPSGNWSHSGCHSTYKSPSHRWTASRTVRNRIGGLPRSSKLTWPQHLAQVSASVAKLNGTTASKWVLHVLHHCDYLSYATLPPSTGLKPAGTLKGFVLASPTSLSSPTWNQLLAALLAVRRRTVVSRTYVLPPLHVQP